MVFLLPKRDCTNGKLVLNSFSFLFDTFNFAICTLHWLLYRILIKVAPEVQASTFC